MKKILKRIISLFLVLSFCFTSMAAVVSDNDGSAFITKAEFDSLKNNFQAQIDQYNTSIDNKIDGAIAAYLSGVSVTKKQESKVITSNWKTVDFLNDIVKPEFAYPNLRLNIAYAMYAWDAGVASGSSGTFNNKLVSFDLTTVYNKTWSNTETNLRPLVTVSGDESNHKNYYWNGIANRYVESVVATTIGSYAISDFAYMDAGTSLFRFYVNNVAYLADVGYNANLLTKSDFWKGDFKYQYRTSTSTSSWNSVSISPTSRVSSNILQAKLYKVNDEEKQCEHIIQYKAETQWPVSNETFSNTFSRCSLNTKQNNNYATATSKSNYGKALAAVKYYTDNPGQVVRGDLSITYNNADTNIVPSVGYIGEKRSDAIYQFKDTIETSLDGTEWQLENISLQKGIPLHGIKNQYDIEWSCIFDGVKWTNASNQLKTDSTREVDLYFSYGPFKDKLETDRPAYVAKDNNGNDINYITTANRKGKILISGTKDDVIYMKCIPHFESSESALKDKFWRVSLNLKDSTRVYYTNNN